MGAQTTLYLNFRKVKINLVNPMFFAIVSFGILLYCHFNCSKADNPFLYM